MNCLHCGTELIHGGDHDGEEEDDYDIVSNLSCPKCETYVYVYHSASFFSVFSRGMWGYQHGVNPMNG